MILCFIKVFETPILRTCCVVKYENAAIKDHICLVTNAIFSLIVYYLKRTNLNFLKARFDKNGRLYKLYSKLMVQSHSKC